MARDQEYDNTNRGALFENNNTRGNKKAPQWRGQCTIQTPDGELLEFWVSCWEQESRKGDTYLSLSFEEKEEDQRRDSGRGRENDDRRSRARDDDDRGSRRSVVGRGRRDDDDDRGSRRRDDDDRRRRDDDRPATSSRKAVDEDLDDGIPF